MEYVDCCNDIDDIILSNFGVKLIIKDDDDDVNFSWKVDLESNIDMPNELDQLTITVSFRDNEGYEIHSFFEIFSIKPGKKETLTKANNYVSGEIWEKIHSCCYSIRLL
jgi:hypothetical protein